MAPAQVMRQARQAMQATAAMPEAPA